MKTKSILPLLISAISGLLSCKKDKQAAVNYPAQGTWQQASVRLYGDSLGRITYDTTYHQPFNAADDIAFTANSCIISSDHYYYPNTEGYPKSPQAVPVSANTLGYTSIGSSKYVLIVVTNFKNYSGLVLADTVEILSPHTLLLHCVLHAPTTRYVSITDSYYEK